MFRRELKFMGLPEENEIPPRISTQFTCPKCGGHDLNIESADVLGCQRVKGIDEQGNLVLDRPTFYTDESHFYLECPDCSYAPDVDLDVPQAESDLAKWITEHCGRAESEDHINES